MSYTERILERVRDALRTSDSIESNRNRDEMLQLSDAQVEHVAGGRRSSGRFGASRAF